MIKEFVLSLKEKGFIETLFLAFFNISIKVRSIILCVLYQCRGYTIPQSNIFYGKITFRRSIKNSFHMGVNNYFAENVKIQCFNSGKIKLGDNILINDNTIIHAGKEVIIGNNTYIGPFCFITDINHTFSDLKKPIRLQEINTKKIVIHEDVWLGAHVVVLQGVSIGKGSIIGAGAVVTKDIPPYSIAVGIPAKVISKR